MLLGWEDTLGIAAGVAGGSIPVVVTYLLNERAARRQLGREQEYERRRDGYERVLLALDKQRDLTQAFQMFSRLLVANRPAEAGPSTPAVAGETQKLPPEFVLFLSRLFAVVADIMTDSPAPSLPPTELFDGKPEHRERILGIVTDATVRGLTRAALEVRSASRSLLLADGSSEFLNRADNLYGKMAIPSSTPMEFVQRDYDWSAIDSEIANMNLIALQDLKSILGEELEVELSRARPIRSVETKKAPKARQAAAGSPPSTP